MQTKLKNMKLIMQVIEKHYAWIKAVENQEEIKPEKCLFCIEYLEKFPGRSSICSEDCPAFSSCGNLSAIINTPEGRQLKCLLYLKYNKSYQREQETAKIFQRVILARMLYWSGRLSKGDY